MKHQYITRSGFVRTVAKAIILLAILFACVISQFSSAQNPAPDAIIGRWRWFNDQIKLFQSDGKIVGDGEQGSWKRLNNATPPRYELRWENDKFVDSVLLVKGGKEIKGTNNKGAKISATRLE